MIGASSGVGIRSCSPIRASDHRIAPGGAHHGGVLVGYARVSTHDRTLTLQQDALTTAGCDRIFTDTASSATADRAGVAEALQSPTMRVTIPLLLALAGLIPGLLGMASAFNVLSIRELLLDLELWRALGLAERTHGRLRHDVVQGLELGFGLVGLALLGSVAWWVTRPSTPGRSKDEAAGPR